MNDLRIRNRRRGKRLILHVNGKPITAYAGETLFTVLQIEGIRTLRPSKRDPTKTAGGGFCGMGVCQECRVTIDGMPDRRACMTEVREGMEVETGGR